MQCFLFELVSIAIETLSDMGHLWQVYVLFNVIGRLMVQINWQVFGKILEEKGAKFYESVSCGHRKTVNTLWCLPA